MGLFGRRRLTGLSAEQRDGGYDVMMCDVMSASVEEVIKVYIFVEEGSNHNRRSIYDH